MASKPTRRLVVDLVRHAESIANLSGRYSNDEEECLSAEGRRHAKALARILDSQDYSRVISSPYRRCLQTAELLTERKKVEIERSKDVEEMRLGPWAGLTASEISRADPSNWHIWNEKPDQLRLAGRETLHELQQRALGLIESLLKQEKTSSPILVVTHVAVIRVLTAHFLGLSLSKARDINVPNLALFRIEIFPEDSAVWQLVTDTAN